MRLGTDGESTVLSALEFDVVCEAEELTAHRHVVLDVPSPGRVAARCRVGARRSGRRLPRQPDRPLPARVRPSGDGRPWSTIAPASNERIAEYARELLAEVTED